MITTLITMTMNNSDQTITATRMHTNNIINFGSFTATMEMMMAMLVAMLKTMMMTMDDDDVDDDDDDDCFIGASTS